MPATHRDRVGQLLRDHAPEKLAELDDLMAAWSGREDQLIHNLQNKFAPSEESQPSPAPAKGSDPVALRGKLIAFYTERCPEKLADVDAIVETMGPNLSEDEIMARLERKYPPRSMAALPVPESALPSAPTREPPAADGAFEQRLRRFFMHHDRSKLSIVPTLLAQSSHDEEALMKKLVEKFGPEPDVDDDLDRRKLTAIYTRYDPSRIRNVDSILGSFAGNESEMYHSIKKKYNISDEEENAIYVAAGIVVSSSASDTTLSSKSPRERLIAIYTKHEPAKLANVDKILEAFAGNEAEMLRSVRAKYGLSERDEAQLHLVPQSPGASSITLTDRDKVITLYTQYEPAKLERLDQILSSFQGQMPAMYDAIRKKFRFTEAQEQELYRTIPTGPKATLVAFFLQQQPSKLKDVDQLLEAFAGNEAEMFQKLEAKYGGSATRAYKEVFVKPRTTTAPVHQSSDALKARLVRFFTKWNPSALPQVDEVAVAFQGRDDELFRDLVSQYGPEPSEEASNDGTSNSAAATGRNASLRARVERFYAHYCPDNLSQIDKIIEAFESNEAVIMAALVQKYGPEPTVTPVDERTREMMDTGPEGMRRRLTRFYEKFAPDKLQDIEKVLQVWAGREEDLFAALNDKYHVPPDQQIRLPGPSLTDIAGVRPAGESSPRALAALDRPRSATANGGGALKQDDEPCIEGRGKLVLYISGASGLIAPRRRRYNDGVLAVVLYPTKEMFRTSCVSDEAAPSWTEFEGQTLLVLNPDQSRLVVRLMDADQNFLGEATLNLREMPFVGVHEFELKKRSPEVDPFVAEALSLGFVKIRWGFMPEFTLPAGNEGASDEGHGLDWRLMRLRAFFARYIPERLAEVPSIAKQFAGREIDLLDVLSLRFGPEPDPYEYRSRLERIFSHYDPSRVREAAAIAMQSGGRDDYVIKSLTKKYGPEPGAGYSVPPPTAVAPNPPNDRHRVRLTRWFMLLMPRRVVEVDYFLFRFAGREDVMFRQMIQTLGPEPTSETPRENIRSRNVATPALQAYFARRKAPPFLTWLWTGHADSQEVQATSYDPEYFRLYKRLERFYQHYNPIKVREIEETLSRWKGREDLLFEALVHKYGSEPAETVPARELTATGAKAAQAPLIAPPTIGVGTATKAAQSPLRRSAAAPLGTSRVLVRPPTFAAAEEDQAAQSDIS